MLKLSLSLLCSSITGLAIIQAPPSPAADIAYQGTHILTHGAFQELATAFENKTGVVVLVKGGGCADGIAVVLNDRREMGGICCPLNSARRRIWVLCSTVSASMSRRWSCIRRIRCGISS